MTEMRQYVCWTDAAVTAVTPRDAASLASGHFQAVHHPLKLWQQSLNAQSGGRWVEETEIIRVLKGPLRPDGYLLVPIVGGSGTGKSHLVRWVWNCTRDRNNWESRYLAKNRTSIRHVIETVIEDLGGPAIEAAREALLNAPARSENEQVLAERLLDELALITSEESSARINVDDPKTAEMVVKLRRELPDILRDPVVRRRLTVDDAVIPRLVGLAMRGRRDGDGLDDDAIRVTDDDLPVTFAEIGETSSGARKLLGQLGSIPNLMSVALDLINEALPSAIKRVFISGQVDLIEVFREVRRELLNSGKELVLFIEDLTVLHGVEREFLDAIIEPARSSDGDLCALRVLFAVTDGHFYGLDTVRTRCDDAYRLDTSYGPEGVVQEEAMSFLGRYLNVCRQDPTQVEKLWINRQDDMWVPNACDVCDHQMHCHEAFGRSEEGYGLYPYNPTAVDRFVMALSSERFDPREVVRELVNRFLVVATNDLKRGDFPSDELIELFNKQSNPLDPIVQSELKSKRPVDHAQIANLMRYWSEDSTVVREATLAAFGLDALVEWEVPQKPRSRLKGKPKSGRKSGHSKRHQVPEGEVTLAERLRSPWSQIFEDLDTWVGNRQDLGASATNNLKKLIRSSILQNLDYSALPTNFGTDFDNQKRFDHERHIRIVRSVTDQSRSDPIIVIEQDADTAAALQGLILLAELPDIDDYPQADNYRRQTARYLEEWTLCITSILEQSPESTTVEAINGLLVCAVVSGACEEAFNSHDYLSSLFGAADLTEQAHRSPEWQDLVQMAGDTYHRLRPVVAARFGEARGLGGVRAVRADLILSVIQDFTKSWSLKSADSATDRFMRSVKSTVENEWEVFELLATGAKSLVDPKRSWSEQSERVLQLVETAHRSGRLRDHDVMSDLQALTSSLDENAHEALLETAELMGSNPPFIERLRVMASNLPETVRSISRFVTRAEQVMRGIAEDLEDRRARESEDESIEDVTSGVLDALSQLEGAIEEFKSDTL